MFCSDAHRYQLVGGVLFLSFLILCGCAQRRVDGDGANDVGADDCEYGRSRIVRTTLVSGRNLPATRLEYAVIEGLAVFEGDIVIGTARVAEEANDDAEDDDPGTRGIVITGDKFRWPEGKIPYEIAADLPDKDRVKRAIEHWEAKTRIRFVPRGNHADFVTFGRGSGCRSSVGRQGGQQFVTLSDSCPTGSVIHEIGHVVGLWHEQSREDRDKNVKVHWENIIKESQHNFKQHINDGDDAIAYDYKSIMHYKRNAFGIDPAKDTLTPIPTDQPIGQREGLSDRDIAAVRSIYP
jgi:hypothetical protein